jgi:hypothetical protein
MSTVNHYFEPPRMTKTSHGNVKGCCDAPEADHRLAVDGTPIRIELRRDVHVYGRGDLGKGSRIAAFLHVGDHAMQEVRPSKWGTNILGQFAELDKGEYRMVQSVGYSIPSTPGVNGSGTVIPVKWAKEI